MTDEEILKGFVRGDIQVAEEPTAVQAASKAATALADYKPPTADQQALSDFVAKDNRTFTAGIPDDDHEAAYRAAIDRLQSNPEDDRAKRVIHSMKSLGVVPYSEHREIDNEPFNLSGGHHPPETPPPKVDIASNAPASLELPKPSIRTGQEEDPRLDEYLKQAEPRAKEETVKLAEDLLHRGQNGDVHLSDENIRDLMEQTFVAPASRFGKMAKGLGSAVGGIVAAPFRDFKGAVKSTVDTLKPILGTVVGAAQSDNPIGSAWQGLGGAAETIGSLPSAALDIGTGTVNLMLDPNIPEERQQIIDNRVAAYKLKRATHEELKGGNAALGFDPNDPAYKIGALAAWSLIPLGVEGKLAPITSRLADAAIEKGVQWTGKGLELAGKVGKAATPAALAAAELYSHGTSNLLPVIAGLVAKYANVEGIPVVGGVLAKLKHLTTEAPFEFVSKIGNTLSRAGEDGVPILQTIRDGVRTEWQRKAQILEKLKAENPEAYARATDMNANPADGFLYKPEDLSGVELKARKYVDGVAQGQAREKALKDYVDLNRVLSDGAKFGLRSAGNVAVGTATMGGLMGASAEYGKEEETMQGAASTGMLLSSLGAFHSSKAGKLANNRADMIKIGRKIIDQGQLVELHPEVQDFANATAAMTAPFGGKVEIVGPEHFGDATGADAPRGKFDPETKTIYLNREQLKTNGFMHELIHLGQEQAASLFKPQLSGIQGKFDEGNPDHVAFRDTYLERLKVGAPDRYDKLMSMPEKERNAEMANEVQSEQGRGVTNQTSVEEFYGGKSGGKIVSDWLKKVTGLDKIGDNEIVKVPGFHAPMTGKEARQMSDALYQIGAATKQGKSLVEGEAGESKPAPQSESLKSAVEEVASVPDDGLAGVSRSDAGAPPEQPAAVPPPNLVRPSTSPSAASISRDAGVQLSPGVGTDHPNSSKDKLRSPAIMLNDGIILRSFTHGDAVKEAHKMGIDLEGAKTGFVTDSGKFLEQGRGSGAALDWGHETGQIPETVTHLTDHVFNGLQTNRGGRQYSPGVEEPDAIKAGGASKKLSPVEQQVLNLRHDARDIKTQLGREVLHVDKDHESGKGIDAVAIEHRGRVIQGNLQATYAKIHQLLGGQTRQHVIIGAGPFGLRAAVHSAYEGNDVLVLEANHEVGGQALGSLEIKNASGEVAGESGEQFFKRVEQRALNQGAEIRVNAKVKTIRTDQKTGEHIITLQDGSEIRAHYVQIGTGAKPKKFTNAQIPGIEDYAGHDAREALPIAKNHGTIVVLGAGNSATQSAISLAARGGEVHLVNRSEIDGLKSKMSGDQFDRVTGGEPGIAEPHITTTKSIEKTPDGRYEVTLANGEKIVADHVLNFLGTDLNTEWLPPEIQRDATGAIKVGPDITKRKIKDDVIDKDTGEVIYRAGDEIPKILREDHHQYETSVKGIFAGGDAVRGESQIGPSANERRIDSAMGDGANVSGAVTKRIAKDAATGRINNIWTSTSEHLKGTARSRNRSELALSTDGETGFTTSQKKTSSSSNDKTQKTSESSAPSSSTKQFSPGAEERPGSPAPKSDAPEVNPKELRKLRMHDEVFKHLINCLSI